MIGLPKGAPNFVKLLYTGPRHGSRASRALPQSGHAAKHLLPQRIQPWDPYGILAQKPYVVFFVWIQLHTGTLTGPLSLGGPIPGMLDSEAEAAARSSLEGFGTLRPACSGTWLFRLCLQFLALKLDHDETKKLVDSAARAACRMTFYQQTPRPMLSNILCKTSWNSRSQPMLVRGPAQL